MSICHAMKMNSLSICKPHDTSVCHAMKTNSLSICQPHDTSIHHTNIMTSPSVCPSIHSSGHHATIKTSPSLCQSRIPSVCHNVIPTSLSICQFQDSSVCKPTRDVINPTIWLTVCSSSVTSILPSANPTVKMPMSTPVRNFPHDQNLGKIPFIHTSTELSVHHTDSPSVNSSLSAANLSKIPCNYGEKNVVNYLHENLVKSPTISTLYMMPFSAPVHALCIQPICSSCDTSVIAPVDASSIQPVHSSCDTSVVAPVCALSMQPVRTLCVTSVFAPVHASPVLSVLPYDDKHQEFPDGFPSTKYGEKTPSEITVKFPHDVTLTLQQAKFPDETPDTTMRVIYLGSFMLT